MDWTLEAVISQLANLDAWSFWFSVGEIEKVALTYTHNHV